MPPVVAAAGIAAGANLVGGIIGGKAAKGAAKVQSDSANQALAEQKRIYEIEDKKERERYEAAQKKDEERYRLSRSDIDYDRNKTASDEAMVRGSRQNAFGGFGGNLAKFSQGYAPAYGMSAAQTQGVMDQRNAGLSGGGPPVAPSMGDAGGGPAMPPTGGGPEMPPMAYQGAQGSGALGSTVWLQSPDGEQREVPIQDAPKLLQAGAVLIATPTGGQ